jgi:hypothetical protein
MSDDHANDDLTTDMRNATDSAWAEYQGKARIKSLDAKEAAVRKEAFAAGVCAGLACGRSVMAAASAAAIHVYRNVVQDAKATPKTGRNVKARKPR